MTNKQNILNYILVNIEQNVREFYFNKRGV